MSYDVKNVGYIIQCNNCKLEYIGETGNTFLVHQQTRMFNIIAFKDIHSDHWKVLVLSLVTARAVIKLEEV